MTQAEIDVANDFPRNGTKRLVLPGLDVPRAPVVDENDTEDVLAKRRGGDRPTERAADADDEPELELDVEPSARAEARLGIVGPLRLAARPHDWCSADHDGACPAVVPDRKVTPVRQKRFRVRAEEASEVRGVLERRVEVDVVGNFEREVDRRLLEGNDIAASLYELRDALERPFPGSSPLREKRIQARLGEDRVAAARCEVENSAPDSKPNPRLVSFEREDPETDRSVHSESIPRLSSSSTGSKKLQLPIE